MTDQQIETPNDDYSRMAARASAIAAKAQKERDSLFYDEQRINAAFAETYTVKRPKLADTQAHEAEVKRIDQEATAELGEMLAVLDAEDVSLRAEIERLSAWDYWATLPVKEIEQANALTPMIKEDVAGDPAVLLARMKAAKASGDMLRLQLYKRYIDQAKREERRSFDINVLTLIQSVETTGNPNVKKIEQLQAKHDRVLDAYMKLLESRRKADSTTRSRAWRPS